MGLADLRESLYYLRTTPTGASPSAAVRLGIVYGGRIKGRC